jgi:hypothetical protein
LTITQRIFGFNYFFLQKTNLSTEIFFLFSSVLFAWTSQVPDICFGDKEAHDHTLWHLYMLLKSALVYLLHIGIG